MIAPQNSDVRADDGHGAGGAPRTQIVTFEVEGWRYGLWLSEVLEVTRAAAIMRLDRGPTVIEGVINFRGTIVPVFDLRARFRLSARAVRASDHMILSRTPNRMVALRVDRVTDLCDVPPAALEAARQSSAATPCAAGALALPDGLLLLCDLPAFLSEAESLTLDAALDDLTPQVVPL